MLKYMDQIERKKGVGRDQMEEKRALSKEK